MAKGGFRGMPGGMGGMNQAAMIKQAQKMQQEMLRMQEEMENKTYSAAAGGGMVKASAKLGRMIRVKAFDKNATNEPNQQMEQLLQFGRTHSDIINIKEH